MENRGLSWPRHFCESVEFVFTVVLVVITSALGGICPGISHIALGHISSLPLQAGHCGWNIYHVVAELKTSRYWSWATCAAGTWKSWTVWPPFHRASTTFVTLMQPSRHFSVDNHMCRRYFWSTASNDFFKCVMHEFVHNNSVVCTSCLLSVLFRVVDVDQQHITEMQQ